MKKIVLIGAALLVMFITLSAVSADEGWSFNFSSSDDTNSNGGEVKIDNNDVTIQGIKFTIPDGYKENESARVVGDEANKDEFPNSFGSSAEFVKGNDSIIIKVIYGNTKFDDSNFEPSNESVANKIANVDGNQIEYKDGISFTFLKDGKVVEVFAPDADTLTSLLSSMK